MPRLFIFSGTLNNSPMQTVDETRRTRLGILVSELGSQSALAAKIGKTPAQLNQWLRAAPDSKSGKPRAMRSDIAREIESSTGKPHGWMDTPPNYEELHPNDRIAHAMRVMECMTPYQLDQAVRVLDTLAQPPLKNGTED